MDRIRNTSITILICAFLSAVTLAAFWPVFQNGFVSYDDPQYLTENPHVLGGLTLENARWAFQTDYAGNWHPLTWLVNMLVVQIFGLKPAWHHLVSLLLHLANTLLLFLVLQRTTGAAWRSAAVAALFAVHPLHVESVAWVAERKDVLSTFFALLAMMAYCRYARRPLPEVLSPESPAGREENSKLIPLRAGQYSKPIYLLSLTCFALALMSKPMVVALPLLLLLLDYWPLGRWVHFQLSTFRSLILEKLPFFALAIGCALMTFLAHHRGHAVSTMQGLPLEVRVANAIHSYAKYLWKIVWPTNLAVFYPHPATNASAADLWLDERFLLCALALMAVSVSVLLYLKRYPWLATGWFWYIGALIPVIGILQVGGQAMADRWTYVPAIGIFICFVWGAAELLAARRFGNASLSAAGVLVVLACAAATQRQVRFWRDNVALFQHALSATGRNPVADCTLGLEEARRGNYEQALTHYRAAVEADPSYGEAYYGMGLTLGWMGKLEEAVEQYRTALRFMPYNAPARNNLGATLWLLGKRDEAVEQYTEALRYDPEYVEAHFDLASALAEEGKLAEAAAHLSEAVRLKPDFVEAHARLADVLAKQGKLDGAIAHLEAALRLRPDAQTYYNLGLVRAMQGRSTETVNAFEQAVKLQPDWTDALNDLAWIRATAPSPELRNGPEAVRLAKRACELNGQEARFWGTLDAAYAEAGQLEEAIATAEKTRKLALEAQQSGIAQAAEKRLVLYRNRQAFHQ